MRSTRREALLVATTFAAASLILTYPLVTQLRRMLPSDLTDTLLNAWTIGWDADRLRHGLRGVWDAPIFFPYRDALAFSETLFGLAIFVAPVYWITADAVLTYNIAFLLSFVLAGIGMYLLARELIGSRPAALIAGMSYAFGPFRMAQIAHVQMVATGWLPLALFGLHRYFSTRRAPWLSLFAGAWILQTLSNTYVGYFIAVPIAAVLADGLWRLPRLDARRALLPLTIAGVVVAAALAPVGLGYFRARSEYHQVRRVEEIAAYGADARAYVVGKNTIGVWRWLPTAVASDPEKELFPGIFAVMFAALGVWSARRDPRWARWAWLYGVVVVIAAVLSLGPTVRVWGTTVTTHGPYEWLLRVVPAMNGMRVPARFAIVVIAGLSVLVAGGVAWAIARVKRPLRTPAIAVCLIAILADGFAAPIPTVRYSARGRAEDRAVASWLADRAPGAVLHLPAVPASFQTLDYQFMTLVHHRPIVNGYSGYETPLLSLLDSGASPLNDLERFPAAVRMLRALGVRYVVVHPGDYGASPPWQASPEQTIRALRASGQIAHEAGLPLTTAFELQPWNAPGDRTAAAVPIDAGELTMTASEAADRLPNLIDRDPDSRWIAGIGGQDGSSWVRVQLAHPADVARVDLQIAERSIGDYPRALRIEGVDAAGRTRVLYEETPFAEFAAGLVRDDRYPTLAVALPPNDTVALWIRQTAPSRASWSIHELRLWRQPAPIIR